MQDYQRRFIELALQRGVLKFGSFTLKSGRQSPYFFNAGGFCTGEDLYTLGSCYLMCSSAQPIRAFLSPALLQWP